MTEIIINANFTIDSMMTQYKSFDFIELWKSDKGKGACNSGLNPNYEDWYGTKKADDAKRGYSISPLEVVLHKRAGSAHGACKEKSDPSLTRYGENEICNYDAKVDDLSDWIENYVLKNTR